MSTAIIALAYIFIWVALVSIPWVFKACQGTYYKHRITLWILAVIILGVFGYGLDMLTIKKPHEAYQSGTFYVTFMLMSVLFSTPSFLYFKAKQQAKK